MKKNIINKVIVLGVLFVLSLIICMQSAFAPSGSYGANSDAAIYKQIGFSITKGKIPYLDIYDNKGPVFYYLNALGEVIHDTYGIFIVELFLMFIATIFCYKIARLFTNKSISILSTVIVFSGLNNILWSGNMTEEFVLPFTFVAMYFFIKYLLTKEVRALQIVTIGVCFAVTIMIRANLIAIYIGFILVIFIDMLVRKKIKELFMAIICFLIGASATILPIAIYLHYNNALIECIKQVYLGPSGYFPETTIIKKTQLLYLLLSNLNNNGFVFIIWYIGYVIYLYGKKVNNEFKIIHLAMLLSILSNMYLSTMSNSNFSHYTMSFIPLLIIPTSIILSKINSNIKKDNCMIMVLITIFLTSKSMAACVDNIYRNIKGKYDRGFYYAINELTTEDETIYIFDGYMQMYHTKRLSASKYIYTPIQFNIPQEDKIEILDELLDELQTNKPKLILISDKAYEKYTNLPYYNFKPYIELMEKNYVQGQKINDFNVYILVND